MSKETERSYLTKIMFDEAQSNSGLSNLPIAYPNQEFNVPKNAPFAEFHITTGPKPVITGGEGRGRVRVRYVGFVQLTLWAPQNSGTANLMKAGDIFRVLFQFRQGRDADGSSYRFGAAEEGNVEQKKGSWFCYVVRVPFERDTIESVQITI
ncbi:hypothetical protein [Erythrobacter phage vB_EliS-L02]|nr:hypothetical protein [Erythrobacter phage vB_EliS-L02]